MEPAAIYSHSGDTITASLCVTLVLSLSIYCIVGILGGANIHEKLE